MKFLQIMLLPLVVVVGLGGCASRIKVAQTKSIEAGGDKFDLGGTYDPAANELVLVINGDPVMRGAFPPYTPTLRLNATYKNRPVTTSCYFGTILGGGTSRRGIIASSVQAGLAKGGDKCDVTVGGASESLFF